VFHKIYKDWSPSAPGYYCDREEGGGQLALAEQVLQKIKEEVWDSMLLLLLSLLELEELCA
jgi:hypothetical protein